MFLFLVYKMVKFLKLWIANVEMVMLPKPSVIHTAIAFISSIFAYTFA